MMHKAIEDINQYLINGLKEFSEHPINYTLDIVKDYWDLGIAVGYGLAWTRYGNELYGNMNGHVILFSLFPFPVTTAIASKINKENFYSDRLTNRFIRNFYMGAFTAFTGADIGNKEETFIVDAVNKALELLLLTAVISMDIARKRSNREAIEEIVNHNYKL